VADRSESLALVSTLLQYPTAEVQRAVREPGPAPEGPGRGWRRIEPFCEWFASTPLGELQRTYVETFDFDRRASLHLTYHLHGDRRQRGLALLRLRRAYAAAGLEVTHLELPDYLPLMLEFAALAPEQGLELLDRHRVGIELVRAGLGQAGSPYRALLDAVVAHLPGLTRHQLGRVRRLASEGPPTEEVGLEPFAPPEVMPLPGGPPAQPMVGGGR
jgi:nitrate reductase delta subunit